MMNLSLLILISIVLTANVEILKGLINSIVNMFQKKEFKYGVILAIILGFGGAITSNVGFVETCVSLVFKDFVASSQFHIYDLISTSLLISKGSGKLIEVFENWTEGRKQLESIGK